AIRATVVLGFFEVLLLGQHLGLKRLPTGGRRRSTIPSLLRTDQPKRRILREPLGLATYNPFAGGAVGNAPSLARPSPSSPSSAPRSETALHTNGRASACGSSRSTSASTLE